MKVLGIAAVLSLFATLAMAVEPLAPRDVKAVQAKLRGDWREFDVRVPPEKQLRESFGLQWTMFQPADPTSPPNQAWITDHDDESKQTDGVLLLDVNQNRIWLDYRFKDGAGDFVQVGILRFDGDTPRWALNKEWIPVAVWEKAKGDLRQRPTAFEDEKGEPIGYRLEPFTFGDR
jgi:hypothetical protein